MQKQPNLLLHAKRMRRSPTDAEALLWRQLRAGRLCQYKFKRQQPIGRFIVDFVCFTHKLIIEVDGGQHLDLQSADEVRTAWLQKQGLQVIRFWNDDVLQRCESVLEEIVRVLES